MGKISTENRGARRGKGRERVPRVEGRRRQRVPRAEGGRRRKLVPRVGGGRRRVVHAERAELP